MGDHLQTEAVFCWSDYFLYFESNIFLATMFVPSPLPPTPKLRHLFFLSTKKDTIICVNNVIPSTNLLVTLDAFHSLDDPRNSVAWLIPKENSSYCVLNFHLVWNTSRYERLYTCLFVFMVLFCSSFGSRSERPRTLQLLIKMLIRLWLMWEGHVLLYRNLLRSSTFVFGAAQSN